MDPVTMTFYGTICGLLAAFTPTNANRLLRFALGLAVGLIAALALPLLRRAMGI